MRKLRFWSPGWLGFDFHRFFILVESCPVLKNILEESCVALKTILLRLLLLLTLLLPLPTSPLRVDHDVGKDVDVAGIIVIVPWRGKYQYATVDFAVTVAVAAADTLPYRAL